MIKARLFGKLHVEVGGQPIERFRTRGTALLLAYLLRYPQPHTRQHLLRMFWKGVPLAAAQNNLRVMLSSLRQQLEPPGIPAGTILQTDRRFVGLNPELVETDVAAFEHALHQFANATDPAEQRRWLEYACHLYAGEFLAEFNDPWVQSERERLRQLYEQAQHQLQQLQPASASTASAPRAPTTFTASNPPCGLGVVLGLESETRLERLRGWARQVIAASEGFVLEATETGIRAFFGSLDGLLKSLDILHAQLKECRFAIDVGELRYALGRYGGTPLQVVEQLLQVGSPQQILCTGRVALLLPQARMNKQFAVRHLGCYRLSERVGNEQVYQLDFVGRERVFAPLRARSPLRMELMRIPTSFIGREVELSQLQAWIQGSEGGFITIVGAPGVGKSRLALELMWRVEPLFGEARWWVALPNASESVAETLARRWGWEWRGLEPFVSMLQAALGDQPALLGIDTAESLAEGQKAELLQLLQRIPTLRIVLAAQTPLGLTGEQLFWLEPLPTPPEEVDTIEVLLRYAAVRLFVERARRVQPDFRLTPRNAKEVSALCRQLEGLPLAIELAAARVGSMSLQEMIERLRHSIAWLDRRSGGVMGHSLLASLEATYRMLSDEGRAFLMRLSVFRGGFTLSGAQAVASPHGAAKALQELTHLSLVQLDGERYRLLEPVRLFAETQLKESGAMEQAQQMHLEYYVRLAEQLGDKVGSWEVLEAERANLEAALAWGVAHAPEQALQLVTALSPFWEGRGSGQGAYEQVCQLPELLTEPDHRLQAARVAISLAVRRGEMERAGALLERYLALAEQHPESLAAARLWVVAGFYCWMHGDQKRSVDYLQRALQRFSSEEAPLDRAEVLIQLGVALWVCDELQEAAYLFQEALELLPPEALPRLRLNALGNLVNILYQQGHYEQAEACLKETLQLAQRVGDQRTVATLLNNWGVWLRDRGEYARARELYMQSHAIWQTLHEGMGKAITLNNMADLAMLEGDLETAQRLFLQSVEMAQRYQLGWYLYHPMKNLAELAERRGDLRAAQSHALHALLACLQHYPVERAIPLMNRLAHYARQQGDEEGAARWLLIAARWMPDPEQVKVFLNTAADYLSPQQMEQLQQEVDSLTIETLLAQLESKIAQETAGIEPF